MIIDVIGMDPSYRNWGLSVGQYNTETAILTISNITVIRTKKSTDKSVRKNSADLINTEYMAKRIFAILNHVKPKIVFVEIPIGSQSASASVSYGICLGLLGCISQYYPIVEVTPKQLKLSVTDNPTASKKEVIDAVYALYPNLNWPTYTKNNSSHIVLGKAEHIADSIAAIIAGINTPYF